MEARNRTLPDWMTRIRTRQIMLPRFQRMEAWGYKEITDLLEAVLRGLPVGSVLILEVGDGPQFVSRPMAGAPETGERVTELLLDGQQRLTALWRAFNNNYDDRTYFLEMPEDANDPEVISISRWCKNGHRFPVWVDDPSACWTKRLVPVHVLCPGEEGERTMDQWIKQAIQLLEDGDERSEIEVVKLQSQLSRDLLELRQQVAQFNLPFLSLTVKTPKEVALDVFIKMNTRTVRLTTFDIIVAQTEETTGQSLHDLVAGLVGKFPALAAYDTAEDLVLGAMALLQDRVPNQTGYLGLDFGKMIGEWSRLELGVKAATEFLEGEVIFDSDRLPTESILAPLIALWTYVPENADERGNATILLRKYIWRSFFTDRYERAAASAALQDFRALRDVIEKEKPEEQVPCFDAEAHPLPSKDELKQAGWPRKRDRLARAILAVSLLGQGHDVADSAPVSRGHLKGREYHHLYPVGYLREHGLDDSLANRALNCALISWKTNRTISAKQPLDYLRERAEASTLGEDEIRRRLKTHAVNFDDLASGDYEAFLENRACLIEKAMEELSDGKVWRPQG